MLNKLFLKKGSTILNYFFSDFGGKYKLIKILHIVLDMDEHKAKS